MKIAIIGSGISGLTAAYHLSESHDITVFEANDYIGGHTHTHLIEKQNFQYFVDTGFIVFNKKTYPHFVNLLEKLQVDYIPTSMSFSVSNEQNGLEYNGTNLNTLFANRFNFFNPFFYIFLKGIINFNKKAKQFLESPSDITLREFYLEKKISASVVKNYLSPMVAAVWSTDPDDVWNLPAKFILQFFENHGFLEVNQRPQWYVIKGGSHSYVKKITAHFKDKIRLKTPVVKIRRLKNSVLISTKQSEEIFDAVILATHSDISLQLLEAPSKEEREILSAIAYTPNPTILHQDRSLLPKKKLAWASWNYLISKDNTKGATVTYNMNILQGFTPAEIFNVTLNPAKPISKELVLKQLNYSHPLFTIESMRAQSRWNEISGHNNTYYCGAYWRNGFHEDGVVSALRVVEQIKSNEK